MADDLSPGDAAPDFDLATDAGGRISLAALRGTPAVVFFYPKADTSGCTKEAVAFSGLKAEFEALGATVVGISPDPVKALDKFKAKHDLTVTLASDEEKAAAEAYGVWVEKSMYGRKYMGVDRSTFLIDADGRIAEAWRKVKVPGHAEAVLAAVRAHAGK
jgi:thioredoxin-dependent peroxiredoxin